MRVFLPLMASLVVASPVLAQANTLSGGSGGGPIYVYSNAHITHPDVDVQSVAPSWPTAPSTPALRPLAQPATSEQYLVGEGAFPTPATLKPEYTMPAKPAKQYFIGGGGVRHLGQQIIFPVQHPVRFGNNCSHPFRHPLVAFGQFSHWVEPYNPGLSACSSLASIAGSAALQTLWAKRVP
jgi:hypothetical protein